MTWPLIVASVLGSVRQLEGVRGCASLHDLVNQARAWGADCILVIMAGVNDEEAASLVSTAHELARSLPLGTKLIGINNRDLRTVQVSLSTTEELARRVPSDRIVVVESGIGNHADVMRLGRSGVRTFVVGESLMRQPDVAAATRTLIWGSDPAL